MYINLREICHPSSLPCNGTNILIFVTCGASFYLRVWSVQLPIQSLYPWVRCIYMFCTLARTSSIPMYAINFYMQEHFLPSLIQLFTHVCDVFTCKNVLYTRMYIFYSHGRKVRAWNLIWASVAKPVLWQLILLPCTLAHMSSIPIDAINFYMQEHFLHSLIRSHKFFLIAPDRTNF